jgi:thioredoxin 1
LPPEPRVVNLTDTTFDATVAGNQIVLVDVWAVWCGPCKRFAPVFEQACTEHPDVVFAKVDADAEQQLARRLKIRGIPTLLAYRDGVPVRRKLGALSPARLQRLIAEVRGMDPQQARSADTDRRAGWLRRLGGRRAGGA